MWSHGRVLVLPAGMWRQTAPSLPVLPGFLLFLAHGAAAVLRFCLRWLTPHDGSRLSKIVARTKRSRVATPSQFPFCKGAWREFRQNIFFLNQFAENYFHLFELCNFYLCHAYLESKDKEKNNSVVFSFTLVPVVGLSLKMTNSDTLS